MCLSKSALPAAIQSVSLSLCVRHRPVKGGSPGCRILVEDRGSACLSDGRVRAADVRLFWHPQGDFLAVQVDRYTKTRKSTFTSFELFSVKERDIPMEARAPDVYACPQHPTNPVMSGVYL